MIFSKELKFSDAQVITADTLSTNIIDLGTPGRPYKGVANFNRDLGKGNPIPILIQVVETFSELTSLSIQVRVSDKDDMSDSTTLVSQTLPVADLVAGKQSVIQVLPQGLTKRYLALYYDVTGTTPESGKITAGITAGNQSNFTGV